MRSRVVPASDGLGLAGGKHRKGVLFAIVGMVFALAIGLVPAAPAQAVDSSVRQTRFGPLTAADQDMLVKVRLAGLWEGPAGREALRRSKNPKVREAGQHLIDGHRDLDNRVLEIGRELGVTLPAEPTGELISRLNQMDRARTDEEYDQRFVDLLRAAHGGVYQLLAKMRAGTRNSLVRQFADQCMFTVLDHITVLEQTGMVNWALLPLPPAPGADQQPQTGMVATQHGPLTLADRDFLVKVRQAGLWEGPSGQQAQERSENQAIKEAGRHMIDGHAELDQTVLEVAGQLNVQLPTEPNADQQAWMAEMAAAPTPAAYDQVFVKRLRAAHGKVFGFVAQIRAGTRNDLIRSFANRTMEIVLDHITMLENTNLVNYAALPPPPEPTSSIPVRGISVNPLMVIAVLLVAGAMTYAAKGRFYRV
jgi:predicted outer membrane protein